MTFGAVAAQQNPVSLATLALSDHVRRALSLIWLRPALVGATLMLCSTRSQAQERLIPLPAAADSGAAWYEFLRTPTIVAYLDTARIERVQPAAVRIWFRFAYAEPMTIGADTTEKFAMTEAREELDCAGRRTKDLEFRMKSLSGAWVGVPMPEPKWTALDVHPFNSGIFLVACRALGTPIPARPGG
jgi:hypothetical protein